MRFCRKHQTRRRTGPQTRTEGGQSWGMMGEFLVHTSVTVETRQLVPSTLYFKQASPSRGGDAGGGSEIKSTRERERKAGEFRNSSVTSTRPTRFPRDVSDTPAEQRETLEPDITEQSNFSCALFIMCREKTRKHSHHQRNNDLWRI
ncbi:hypothetical protein DPX16_4562 [Anabarilius grahami]|uniref:Uncharacterized protein n=1 Tax=Anabarilius grahami TaxID=495550 RepID=A0A3N0YD85_ANAGA|nr:hypothetical protein DPX16_4562 [Anabarilius grahami]